MTLTKEMLAEALDIVNKNVAFLGVPYTEKYGETPLDTLSKLARALHESWDDLAAMEWQPIETAPRDGTKILVFFKYYGWLTVFWGVPENSSVSEPYIWCLDDYKFGPYALRGYCDGEDTHWMPIPAVPSDTRPILKRLIGEV